MNTDLMNRIEAASGRNDKEALLSKETDTRFLKWSIDPMVTFGVTVDEEEMLDYQSAGPQTEYASRASWWNDFNDMCAELSIRELTGHKATVFIEQHMVEALHPDDVLWACRVLNKDLRCGVSVSTVKKVFPSLIEPFACILAQTYDPEKHDLKGDYYVQAKLDGLRMIVINGVAYTRTGKVIDTVGHILNEIKDLSQDWVFDGEVMGPGGFDQASGKTRKKGAGPDTSLIYHVFDVIKYEDWVSKKTPPLRERMIYSGKNLFDNFEHVKQVPSVLVTNPNYETLCVLRDKYISEGFEGIMAKAANAPYEWKRTSNLLKFKKFLDADGTIVECLEGTGKHKGKLGAFRVDFFGVESKVGTGFDDFQRTKFWILRDDLIGKHLEVEYQQKTEYGALRFPVFKRLRPDKD